MEIHEELEKAMKKGTTDRIPDIPCAMACVSCGKDSVANKNTGRMNLNGKSTSILRLTVARHRERASWSS